MKLGQVLAWFCIPIGIIILGAGIMETPTSMLYQTSQGYGSMLISGVLLLVGSTCSILENRLKRE